MPYKRLVPKIVVNWNSTLNKFVSILTKQYQPNRVIGDPISQMRVLQSNLVDEITVVLKSSNFDNRFVDLVEELASNISTPLSVGGSIRNIEQCKNLVAVGVDKLILGRSADDVALVNSAVSLFGTQSVAYSYDFDELDEEALSPALLHEIARKVESQGFGELHLNSWRRDGMLAGPELKLITAIRSRIHVPIVVGCGVGQIKDIFDCFQLGADGVALSSFLATHDQPPKQIRSHLHSMGCNIRYKN